MVKQEEEVSTLHQKIRNGVIIEDKMGVRKLTVGMIRATEEKYGSEPVDFIQMHVSKSAEISEDVKEYAREKGVRIVRIPMYGGKPIREV
jgi:hypothetical protein